MAIKQTEREQKGTPAPTAMETGWLCAQDAPGMSLPVRLDQLLVSIRRQAGPGLAAPRHPTGRRKGWLW